jgi:hypothetical protein
MLSPCTNSRSRSGLRKCSFWFILKLEQSGIIPSAWISSAGLSSEHPRPGQWLFRDDWRVPALVQLLENVEGQATQRDIHFPYNLLRALGLLESLLLSSPSPDSFFYRRMQRCPCQYRLGYPCSLFQKEEVISLKEFGGNSKKPPFL